MKPKSEESEQKIAEEVKEQPEKLALADDKDTPGLQERSQFSDGGFRAWEWTGEVRENPEYRMICKVVGIDPESSEAGSYVHELSNIGQLAFEYLQSTDEEDVYKFLKYWLRRTPKNGNRIWNLERELKLLWKKQ